MYCRNIKLVGDFDGECFKVKTITGDPLSLIIYRSSFTFGEEKLEIPTEFALLLADANTSEEAEKIAIAAIQQNFHPLDFLKIFFREVAEKGFTYGWHLLERLKRNRPRKGSLKIYRSVDTRGEPNLPGELVIADGRRAFRFYVSPPPTRKFPINVYLPETYVPGTFTRQQFEQMLKQPLEFYRLIRKLDSFRDYIREATAQKIIDAFFESKEKYWQLLKKISKTVAKRKQRDRIYSQVFNRGYLKVNGGYVVLPPRMEVSFSEYNLFYVTGDGDIKQIVCHTGNFKQTLYEIFRKGIETVRLTPVEPSPRLLQAVAKVLKNEEPQLAVVFLP